MCREQKGYTVERCTEAEPEEPGAEGPQRLCYGVFWTIVRREKTWSHLRVSAVHGNVRPQRTELSSFLMFSSCRSTCWCSAQSRSSEAGSAYRAGIWTQLPWPKDWSAKTAQPNVLWISCLDFPLMLKMARGQSDNQLCPHLKTSPTRGSFLMVKEG